MSLALIYLFQLWKNLIFCNKLKLINLLWWTVYLEMQKIWTCGSEVALFRLIAMQNQVIILLMCHMGFLLKLLNGRASSEEKLFFNLGGYEFSLMIFFKSSRTNLQKESYLCRRTSLFSSPIDLVVFNVEKMHSFLRKFYREEGL